MKRDSKDCDSHLMPIVWPDIQSFIVTFFFSESERDKQ